MTLIWIPYYIGMENKPQMQRLARKHLKVHPLHAVGILLKLYGWLGQQKVPPARQGDDAIFPIADAAMVIDGVVDVPGLADGLKEEKWLAFDESTLTVFRYFEKNGTMALKKAKEQGKKHLQRSEQGTNTGQHGDGRGDSERFKGGTGERGSKGPLEVPLAGPSTGPLSGRAGDAEGDLHRHKQRQKQNHPTPEDSGANADSPVTGEEGGGGVGGWGSDVDWVGEARKLLEDMGVSEGMARKLAAEHAPGVIAVACKMARERQATGATNPPGIIVNRLRDGSAQRSFEAGRTKDDEISAHEWVRVLLDRRKELAKTVFAAVRTRAEFARWDDAQLRKAQPDAVLVELFKAIGVEVERGKFNAGEIPIAFLNVVNAIGAADAS